jgi:hypothetical protein
MTETAKRLRKDCEKGLAAPHIAAEWYMVIWFDVRLGIRVSTAFSDEDPQTRTDLTERGNQLGAGHHKRAVSDAKIPLKRGPDSLPLVGNMCAASDYKLRLQ